MAEREVKIQFKTSADVSGAKATEEALEKVEVAAEKAEQAAEKAAAAADASGGTSTASTAGSRVDEAIEEKRAVEAVTEALDEQEEKLEEIAVAEKKVADGAKAAAAEGKKIAIKPDVAPIKAAQGSIQALEDELKRLQAELKNLPVGGSEFIRLSGQIGDTTKRLQQAEGEARRFGGTVGRSGNTGLAVLEFSRALEDAQYGIGGVLNNLPGLIAMLGGSAGLAGVVSIAAVGASVLWKSLNKGPDNEGIGSKVDAYKDILKSANKMLGDVAKSQQDVASSTLSESFNRNKDALQQEGVEMDRYIARLKDAIQHEGELAKLKKANALAEVDAAERRGGMTSDPTVAEKNGGITSGEATKRRDQINQRAAQDDEERLRQLEELQIRTQQEAQERAARELAAATKGKEAAEAALLEANEKIEQIKREAIVRKQLDAQLTILEGVAQKADESLIGKTSAGGRKVSDLTQDEISRFRDVAGGGGNYTREQIEEAKAVIEAVDKVAIAQRDIAATQREIAERAPRPITDLVTKTADGSERTIPSASRRDLEGIEKGDARKGILPLAELKAQFESLSDAVEAATKRVNDAGKNVDDAQKSVDQERRQRPEILIENDPVIKAKEQETSQKVLALMESLLAAIPDANSNPVVQALVQKLRGVAEGGVKTGEIDEAQSLLTQISAQQKGTGAQQANIYRTMITSFSEQAQSLRIVAQNQEALLIEMNDTKRRVKGVEESIRAANF